MVLDKKQALFDRDDKGILIPKEVELVIDENDTDELPFKGQTIYMTPLTRGEIKKMFSELEQKKKDVDSDVDGDIIVKHCTNPKFTDEEKPYLKGTLTSIIVNTILANSGLDIGKTRRKAVSDKEDEFGKN